MDVWQVVGHLAEILAVLTPLCAFGYFVWRQQVKPRLDAFRAEQEKARAAIADLSTRIAWLERAIPDIDAQQHTADVNIESLQESARALRDAVHVLRNSDERTRKELTALRELEDSTRWDMAILKDSVNDQAERLAEIATADWPTPELPN
jgi:chromosome segregation ATPase